MRPDDDVLVNAPKVAANGSRGSRTLRAAGILLPILVLPILYVEYTIWSIQNRGLFEYVGIDYRVLRATAEIGWHEGFAAVYSFSSQNRWQQELYKTWAGAYGMGFAPLPFAYLPAFIPLFFVTLPFSSATGFIVWTVLNACGMALYARRFLAAFRIEQRVALIATVMVSAPVFLTLLFGQFTLPLVICFGEFLLAARRDRHFVSGLWIAGLALKPQTLVLLGPALLVGRRFRAIAGATTGGLVLLGLSFLMVGPVVMEGLIQMLRHADQLPGAFPYSMMNWRALALNLAGWPLSPTALGLALVGMAATALVALRAFWLPTREVDGLAAALLIWAATGAVAWHSHVHMSVPLALPLAALSARHRWARWLLGGWVVLPGVVFVETVFVNGPGFAHRVLGLSLFAFNLVCVLLALRALRPKETSGAAIDVQN